LLLSLIVLLLGCESEKGSNSDAPKTKKDPHSHHSAAKKTPQVLHYKKETNLKNINQLTFGGDNAEAYFSFDDKNLVFQATNKKWGAECDQIYMMSVDGHGDEQPPLLSTGKGRTTCSYFMPGNKSILYASTHLADENCPESPRTLDGKYVWPVYKSFDIFVSNLEGKITKQLTKHESYDAEATLSPDGSMIVFTSLRTGDLELFTMNVDGSNIKQVTKGLGYDGGAFFSPDGKKLVFRSSRPKTDADVKSYKDLLQKGLVQPSAMEIYTCNVDGSDLKQITKLGGANWAPYYHPSGNKIIFSSNHHTKSKRQFNLFIINTDGTGLKQITFDPTFDAFPMFSYDGKKLVFSSNRNNGGTRDTNVFIAEWVD